MLVFEYDTEKSDINLFKHGIDFGEAKNIWKDSLLAEIALRYENENRFAVIGKIKDKHWTAIVTYRKNNIRIISVRRSRKNEIEHYESRRIR